MSNPNSILLDARSAFTQRVSGWERYTRSLVNATTGLKSVKYYAHPVDNVL